MITGLALEAVIVCAIVLNTTCDIHHVNVEARLIGFLIALLHESNLCHLGELASIVSSFEGVYTNATIEILSLAW